MENCEFCGKKIGYNYADDACNGEQTLGTNPFAVEIYDNYTEFWECEGSRYESAMDI